MFRSGTPQATFSMYFYPARSIRLRGPTQSRFPTVTTLSWATIRPTVRTVDSGVLCPPGTSWAALQFAIGRRRGLEVSDDAAVSDNRPMKQTRHLTTVAGQVVFRTRL